KGINYYRLKIVDRDNSFKFSDIRSVRNNGNAEFTIYPNPVQDVMKVEIYSDKSDKGIIIVNDINGKQVYSRAVNVVTGDNTFTLDISTMAEGAYFIKIQLSEDMSVKKFTKL
ncbi:MAG: T9SS type A sorting domain-containing protein, partial [Chitinophagaceae bacterium]